MSRSHLAIKQETKKRFDLLKSQCYWSDDVIISKFLDLLDNNVDFYEAFMRSGVKK